MEAKHESRKNSVSSNQHVHGTLRFLDRDWNCTDLFHPMMTDEGLCCSFNVVPEAIMFTDGQVRRLEFYL